MIKICNDRSVFPNSVKVSNQYENDTRSIDFDLSDVQFTGNTYLICKYQGQSTFYAPLLLDSNFSIPVETFLSAQPGAYTCVIVISTVTIDENYDFSSDNPLFVSNEFTLNVDQNFLTRTATAWELTPAAQNYFDQLIALVDKVQEDLESGAFVGNGIKSITLISTVGLVDTYQILFTDNSTFDFQVTNGATPTITIENGIWFVNGISTGVSALGQKGDKGDPGVGIVSIEKTSTSGNVDTYTITFTNQTTSTFTVTNGTNGKDGVTPNIQIGTVTTLPAGSQATASITGTTENPLLNLGIPEGEQGSGGTTNYNDLENKPSINGVELIGNKTSGDLKMYTKEEVDYLLADKMDKPYTSIEITDDITLSDCLDGNFKIDKIKGNTYQTVEENIVPTPSRPVPINSRKVLANGEYVELRSLKESKNLFDNRLFTLLNPDYFALNDDSTGIKIIREEDRGIENIQYEISIHKLFYCHFMCSGGLMITIYCLEDGQDKWRMVQICNDDTTDVTFSVGNNNPAKLKFEIHSSISTETANIALYSYGVDDETKYVPPTVRDYKIVDHTTQTSKIIRNVGLYVDDKTGDSWAVYDLEGNYKYGYLLHMKDMKPSDRIGSYVNIFRCENYANPSIKNAVWMGVNNNYLYVTKTDFTTLDEWKAWLKNNDLEFVYPLETPTEEEITYSASDTNEVGYSWQDTTSPSPTISAEIKGVDKIDITVTGKNLIDIEKIDKSTIQAGVDVNIADTVIISCAEFANITKDVWRFRFAFKDGTFKYISDSTLKKADGYRVINVNEENPIVQIVYRGELIESGQYSQIMLEYGEVTTPYEPYQEQHIAVTLPQQMYSTADKKISDIVNIENKQYEYHLKKVVFDGTNAMFTYLSNSNNVFYTSLDDAISPYEIDTKYILCKNLAVYPANFTTDNFVDNSIKYGNGSGTSKLLFIKINDTITTADMLYMWLKEHPITVYYVVQTPTTLPIPEEELAKLKSLKTEQGVTNIFVGGEVKPIIEARYPQDVMSAVNKLQTKLLTLQGEVIKNV